MTVVCPTNTSRQTANVAATNEAQNERGSIEPAYRKAVQRNNIGILLVLAGDFIAAIALSMRQRHR
jgi:hypothetical protein